MTLERLFKDAVAEFRRRSLAFAVAGGFAADLYREAPRLTMDVDFGLACDSNAEAVALAVLEHLGLKAGLAREADLASGPPFAVQARNTTPFMAVGRPDDATAGFGVDILLPSLPWVPDAVRRAQSNLVDFGFGRIPALTLEDVIVGKLFALRALPIRAKDLDDLQSVLAACPDFDRAYVSGQAGRFGIVVPRHAKPFLPKPLVDLIPSKRKRAGN